MSVLTSIAGIPISIHASAKEATILSISSFGCIDDFNPRLREGGDLVGFSSSSSISISIHASAKEATFVLPSLYTVA